MKNATRQGSAGKQICHAAALAVITFGVAPFDCAKSADTVQGRFFVGPDKVTWAVGRAYCVAHGGDLATISSAQDNEAVQQLVYQFSKNALGCWIGATDADHKGKWMWVNGDKVDYTNWHYGEPNNACAGENYAHMYTDGRWNDQQVDGGCNDYGLMQPVCERRERHISSLERAPRIASSAGAQLPTCNRPTSRAIGHLQDNMQNRVSGPEDHITIPILKPNVRGH